MVKSLKKMKQVEEEALFREEITQMKISNKRNPGGEKLKLFSIER